MLAPNMPIRIAELRSAPAGQLARARRFHRFFFKHYLAFLQIGVNAHGVTRHDFAVQHLQGERVLDGALDSTLQRPRAKLRIVAFAEKPTDKKSLAGAAPVECRVKARCYGRPQREKRPF